MDEIKDCAVRLTSQVSKSLDDAYGDLINASSLEKKSGTKYYVTVKVCKDCPINEEGGVVKDSCCKLLPFIG